MASMTISPIVLSAFYSEMMEKDAISWKGRMLASANIRNTKNVVPISRGSGKLKVNPQGGTQTTTQVAPKAGDHESFMRSPPSGQGDTTIMKRVSENVKRNQGGRDIGRTAGELVPKNLATRARGIANDPAKPVAIPSSNKKALGRLQAGIAAHQ